MTLTATQIEQATLLAWPSLETITDGAWSARFALGYTKRANSIHSLDGGDDRNAEARLDALAAEYRARNLRPTFRVTPLAGPGIIAALDEKGWETFEQSRVLATPLTKRQRLVSAMPKYFEATDPEWRDIQGAMAGYDAAALKSLGQILDQLTVPARGVVVYDEGFQPAGAALAVNANGTAIFLNVVVDPERRGEGFGRAVMHAALNWTSQMGATNAALQVLADNEAALALYRKLGFTDVYGYHYRRAPL